MEDERDAAVARLDQLQADAPERALIQQQVQEVVVQIGSLRAQLAAAKAKRESQRQQLDRVTKEPEFIEVQARDRLDLSRANEIIFQFPVQR